MNNDGFFNEWIIMGSLKLLRKRIPYFPHSKKTKKPKFQFQFHWSGIFDIKHQLHITTLLFFFLLLLLLLFKSIQTYSLLLYTHELLRPPTATRRGSPAARSALEHRLLSIILLLSLLIDPYNYYFCRVPSQGCLPSARVPCPRLPCSSRVSSATTPTAGVCPTV